MYDIDASSSSSVDSVSFAEDESNDESNKDTSHTTARGSGGDDRKNKLAERETKHLKCWRIVLVVVLVAVAAGVCAGTYLFVQDESNEDYKLSVSLLCCLLGTCHDILVSRVW